MDPATLSSSTFLITSPYGTIPGTVSYSSASKTATFTPLTPFFPLTGFSATITTGAKDTAGRSLASNFNWAFTTTQRDFTVLGNTALRSGTGAKGLIYGGAAGMSALETDTLFAAAYAGESGMLVPESELKWNALRPTPDTFDFTGGDWLLSFAQANNMLFRGHNLVWHQALPSWFSSYMTPANAEQMLVNHISTVVGRYAGKVHSWDVVNEAIAPWENGPDGLRTSSPWYQLLGDRYIDIAFRSAAAADPNALLVYNESGLEYDTPEADVKRADVLNLLGKLKAAGTPVHALGIESHLRGAETRFNPDKLRAFLNGVASLGLKIMVTELDVSDQNLPADTTIRDQIVAGAYEDYLSTVLQEPAVIAVMTWGMSDKYSWLSSFKPRTDGLPVRPLPLDATFNRMLAWNAMTRAIGATFNR